MKKKNTVFPRSIYNRVIPFSHAEVKLDGMKVLFDRTATLLPVELEWKSTEKPIKKKRDAPGNHR